VKVKKVLIKELPKGLAGIVLKDGVFKLALGYKFVRKTSDTVIGLRGSVNGPTDRQQELSGILYSTKLIQN
jgi:hypothetical protein